MVRAARVRKLAEMPNSQMPRVVRGDVIRFCELYRGAKFHALLCDPPYHLYEPRSSLESFCGRGVNRQHTGRTERDKELRRGGFMGKRWDGGDIAFNPETWAAFASVMHDGAFGMAFASARGWHRLACAIEDAGLIIHPSIFGWSYGSGFPKATRIDTQIDKAAGAEQIATGQTKRVGISARARAGDMVGGVAIEKQKHIDITAPATPLAATWAGHRYGLQALKPALEPIIVFQKPYRGKPVECITRTGAGALWIDGGRIGMAQDDRVAYIEKRKSFDGLVGSDGGWKRASPQLSSDEYIESTRNGRWASNFILTCAPSCNGAHAPDCPAALLDEQSGTLTSGARRAGLEPQGQSLVKNTKGGYGFKTTQSCEGSTGGASRFFFRAQWDTLEAADPVRYCAKAGRRERDAGLEEFKLKQGFDKNTSVKIRRSNAETGAAEEFDYTPSQRHNGHPCVKPLSLCKYLATLLLPPPEYAPRRLFNPFCGSGSEMIGAMQAGWECVVGVEREAEYVAIAKARLAYWREQMPRETQVQMELAT